jgi:very-short-patch-repair endonuclease
LKLLITYTPVLLVLAIWALLIVLKARVMPPDNDKKWPYYPKFVLTQPEQVLYHRLTSALPDYLVLSQVQVSRVLGVKKGVHFGTWNNRINRLSYDFVICNKDSSVVAAIELDDSSHSSQQRIRTDAKKDKATADAGIRLIRWHISNLPDEQTIQNAILEAQAALPEPANPTSNPTTNQMGQTIASA